MKASAVIVTYNRPELVKRLAEQIRKFDPDTELVVIDQSGKEPNLCRGRNEGIAKASGDIIIFFDDDVEIMKDTISSHLKEFEKPNVVGCAGRVINDGEPVPTETKVIVGEANSLLTGFTKNFWSTKRQTVEFPYGCNMSFRKIALLATGGFDEKLPAPATPFDEIDIALRISNIGLISFSPQALVLHHRATSGGTREREAIRTKQYYQAYARMVRKNLPFPISLLSLSILKIRVIKEAPFALPSLLRGFFF